MIAIILIAILGWVAIDMAFGDYYNPMEVD